MGWARSFPRAFLKAQMGAGVHLPESGTVFLSVKDADKGPLVLETARLLAQLGFRLTATRGTATWLAGEGVEAEQINKIYEGGRTVVDYLKDGLVDIVMNSTEGARAIEDSRGIRSVALHDKIPYFTTAAGSHAAALAIQARKEGDIRVRALQG